MADVFLDLWGVLTDSRKMTSAYRQRAAEVLWSRHGGSIEGWLRAHDVALAWYEGHLADPETWEGGSWVDVVSSADAENIMRMFREAKVPPPPDPHRISVTLDLDVMSAIDAAFPDARSAIARLRRDRHRVFVSTNATEANARGALRGAKLLDELDGLFTGEVLNAGKTDAAYWRGIVDRVKVDPKRSFVVDDRPEYLKGAALVGFRCLLMDREARHPLPAMPPFVDASLRNLAGLPQYVAGAVRAARVRA
jgi:FMN phosphatase YigB (HAD superfamily)